MGLFKFFEKFCLGNVTQANMNYTSITVPSTSKRTVYFSNTELDRINNEFLDHDGYFSKIVLNNKVLGYIFRCTHHNITFKNKAGKEYTIPYLVTCYYQSNIPNVNSVYVKAIGKSRALKSGVRLVESMIAVDDPAFTLDYIRNFRYTKLDYLFPKFDELITYGKPFADFKTKINIDDDIYLNSIENSLDYNNIVEYLKVFDNKVFKYYSDIDQQNIIKIWLKNEN